MAINPELITTIRVDQLPDGTLNLTNKIPHTSGTVLEKASVQDLVDLVATAIGVSGGVGYIALSVTDGQQLPDVPELPSFFLCGAGTFLNINGYPNIICTENLNAIMSLTDHWELAVEIPINPLSGTVESVTGSAVDNTDPINPVVNLNTPTLQEVMETGRGYNQTIGDYTYRLEFDEADGGFISVNDNNLNTISGFQLQQGAALYFSDGISGKSTSVYASDFGAGLVSLANTFGENVLNIPFRTSGSGVTYFQPPNNKPAGSYTLAITDDIPTGGGGASISFYLNGSVSQGTIGGVAFKEMDRTPILGAGTNFTINANGYIQSFITDAGVPNQLEIPAGNWNFETYFSASSGGGSPSFYIELYKWNGTTLSLIASNSTNPEFITGGTNTDLYVSALAVPQTTLLATDRLAVRIYVNHSSKTITLHTEDNNLCQVITTFTTGLTALNGLTEQVQYFDVGTGATNFNISSSGDTHTFNLLFNIRRNANNSSNNNINYNGYAVTGSAESSAVWTITRLTIAASGSITVATATNVAWTNRESATYI